MKIHFICTANAFRSRLAEDYMKSLNIPQCEISSSGIVGRRNDHGPICSYTTLVLREQEIEKYDKGHWDDTSDVNLLAFDHVICMQKNHLDYIEARLGPEIGRVAYEVWGIDDIEDILLTEDLSDDNKINEAARKVFAEIKDKIDNFVEKLALIK